MKVIYIAGKYRDHRGEWFVKENIRTAELAAITVWRMGGVAICPHKNTAFFGGTCDDSVWLAGDLELLRRCDAIFMLDNFMDSEGAKKELEFATESNIPALYTVSDLADFLRTEDPGRCHDNMYKND